MTVYHLRGQFSPKEAERLASAVRKWDLALRQSLSVIRIKPGGPTDAWVPRAGEIIVTRDRVKVDGHQVGEFRGVLRDARGYVTAAVIAFDRSTDDPRNLSALPSHELGHGFGLWDCATCEKRSTVMNGFKFPGRNVADAPGLCDILQVGAPYEASPPGLTVPPPAASVLDASEAGGDAFVEEADGPGPPGAAGVVAGYLLVFPRTRVRMRMTVRYSDYRRFLGKVTVVEEGEPGREDRAPPEGCACVEGEEEVVVEVARPTPAGPRP